MTGSVTCVSVIDNTTTFGPVPVSIHSGTPWLVYSAGGVVSLTPHQTVGEVAVADASTTGFHNIVQRTGYDRFEVIPFAFFTALVPKTASKIGFTGGIGFNPYSGVQGIDFFFGASYRLTNKVYFHVGGHAGRFQDIDPKSGLNFNTTLPPTFPSTVPTRTRFTIHLAFGASYSF